MWGNLATRTGFRASYADALRELQLQLSTDPRGWGDPVRELHGMAATYYRRYGPVLMVFYAVHNARPVVFVQRVVLTPGSPLADADDDPAPA
jgi:hypothetical protein